MKNHDQEIIEQMLFDFEEELFQLDHLIQLSK